MRLPLFSILLFIQIGVFAQSLEESKYLFLLNLEEDTLCLDCNRSNCDALMYNAHLFENLEYLSINSVDIDHQFLKFFPKLKRLRVDCRGKKINKVLESVSQCKDLESLELVNGELHYFFLSPFRNARQFKVLESLNLKHLFLENIICNDPGVLSKDILTNIRNLDSLEFFNTGVNFENCFNEVEYHLEYLGLDANKVGRLRILKRNRSKKKGILRVDHLELFAIAFRNERNYEYLPEDRNISRVLRFCSRSRYYGNVNFECIQNASYGTLFYSYQSYFFNMPRGDDQLSSSVTSQIDHSEVKYHGSFHVGRNSRFLYLPMALRYDALMMTPIYWDSNSPATRASNTAYGNGYIIPIQWRSLDETPAYFSPSKMEKIKTEFQRFAQIEKAFEKDGRSYFKITPKDHYQVEYLEQLNYIPNRRSTVSNAILSKVFTFQDEPENMSTWLSNELLDVWPTFNLKDSTYWIHIKTVSKLDSALVDWYYENGDTFNFRYSKSITRSENLRNRTYLLVQRRMEIKARRMGLELDKDNFMFPMFKDELKSYCNHERAPQLNKDEWKETYSWYKQNKQQAFLGSIIEGDMFAPMLSSSGYQKLSILNWVQQYDSVALHQLILKDSTHNNRSAGEVFIYVIDKKNKTFASFSGNVDVEEWNTKIYSYIPGRPNGNISVFVYQRNHQYYCDNLYANKRSNYYNSEAFYLPKDLLLGSDILELIEKR